MLLSRRNFSSFLTALMFVSISLALFAFVSKQTAFAFTKAQCEALAPGSICKKTSLGGCNDLAGATEQNRGACSDLGVTANEFTCCQNIKPAADTNVSDATCRTFSGASCVASRGLDTAATCTDAGKNAIGRCVAGGAFTGWCCQDKASAAAAATTAATTSAGICSGGQCSLTGCKTGEVQSGTCTSGGVCCKPPGSASGGTQTIPFANPLAFNTVEGLLGSLLGTLQGIIVVLALVFIVIGAILYITSAGNEKQMTLAKGAIAAALIGLAIGIAAPSFLKEISSILGWTATVDCTGKTGADLTACNAAQATLTAGKSLSAIALSVLNFLLSIVGVLAVIMLVIGGIMYLTSAGDEDRIDTGKKIVTYAIVGIAVALAALIIVRQIANFFA